MIRKFALTTVAVAMTAAGAAALPDSAAADSFPCGKPTRSDVFWVTKLSGTSCKDSKRTLARLAPKVRKVGAGKFTRAAGSYTCKLTVQVGAESVRVFGRCATGSRSFRFRAGTGWKESPYYPGPR